MEAAVTLLQRQHCAPAACICKHRCVQARLVRPGCWTAFHAGSWVAESFLLPFRELVGVSPEPQFISSLLLPNKLPQTEWLKQNPSILIVSIGQESGHSLAGSAQGL